MPRIYVTDNLCFDDLSGCGNASADMAVVHACKDPCHKRAVGYTKSLEITHKNYLWLEAGRHLYLNMVDPPVPLFKPESFTKFFEFVDRAIKTRPVLIHCNKGESRAPSLTLLYMAMRLGLLPNDSYEAAAAKFRALHPYKPGQGIAMFLSQNWKSLGC
ncbi:MAG: hypothetical protein GC136_00125 [Alphaproteobacteria bacterium]|nr:hypothetical protein [Alphaproteobacteria bacterium]